MDSECSKVLHDKLECDIFKKFLKNVHACEVLNFWMEVELFKKLETPTEIVDKAKFIQNKYLSFEADTEINVDAKSRIRVQEVLTRGSVFDTSLFNQVQQQAFDLLSSDCFLHFKQSPEYKQLKRPTRLKTISNVVHRVTMRRRKHTDSHYIMQAYFHGLKEEENKEKRLRRGRKLGKNSEIIKEEAKQIEKVETKEQFETEEVVDEFGEGEIEEFVEEILEEVWEAEEGEDDVEKREPEQLPEKQEEEEEKEKLGLHKEEKENQEEEIGEVDKQG